MKKRDIFVEIGYKLLKVLSSINSDLEKTVIEWAINVGTGHAYFPLFFIGFFIFELRLESIYDSTVTKISEILEGIFVMFMFMLFTIYAAYNNGMLPK